MMKKDNLIFGIFIGAIVIFLFVVLFSTFKVNTDKLLGDRNLELVYPRENDLVVSTDRVPVININNPKIQMINEEINKQYSDYSSMIYGAFDYKYSVSKNILSILTVSMQKYIDSDRYDYVYKSYNIDLDSFKLLSNDEILKKFKIDPKEIQFFLENKFINYYNLFSEKRLIDTEKCDFDCFIEMVGVYDYISDNCYYIDNGHLELYRYFYFDNIDREFYRFLVK